MPNQLKVLKKYAFGKFFLYRQNIALHTLPFQTAKNELLLDTKHIIIIIVDNNYCRKINWSMLHPYNKSLSQD